MPTQTFFRLPEEKRTRLTGAAWKEFTAVRLADASINRVVRDARIPRGSFYQYFGGKEDLFLLLLDTMYDAALDLAAGALDEAKGDLFDAVPLVFERLFSDGSRRELVRGMELLRRNDTMDMAQLLMDRARPGPQLESLLRRADVSNFRRLDEAFVRDVVTLLIYNLMFAMREALCGGDLAAEAEALRARVDTVRQGSIKKEALS